MAFDDPVIEEMYLEKTAGGKKVYSIEAQRASFGNKRIGFFNIAIIKVINLENVHFTLYNGGRIIKTEDFNRAVFEIDAKRLLDESGNLIFIE